ncbi:MAG TPA: homoserine dehydrogenase [Mariprofundaceae bacterium]|nr:homoserine dehydrogenase [Mariprofundaceae bacterium]
MSDVRVGLIGFGTIGTGVVRSFVENRDALNQRLGRTVRLARICDRDIVRGRGVDVSGIDLTTDIEDVLSADDIDIVIELIGGYEPARSFVIRAIENGKHVVTANKALIAKYGEELFALAEQRGVALAFEAAVGGGIPCLKALREGLAANRIESVYGILNGTCNYILTSMERDGSTFDEVLQQAQELGYAEADPTFDIEGVDTAHKLSILSAMAFGTHIRFDDVYTEGVTSISAGDIESARELGYRIKLLGIAKPHGERVEMRVHPCLVPLNAQLAQVWDSYNAVWIRGNFVEDTLYVGRGAGERPTASAVMADVLDIARGLPDCVTHLAAPMAFPQAMRREAETLPVADVEGEYYLRLMVKDEPGVLAAVTEILAYHRISLEALIQKERHKTQAVPIVMTTHNTLEGNLRAAVARISELDSVEGEPLVLHIERFGD